MTKMGQKWENTVKCYCKEKLRDAVCYAQLLYLLVLQKLKMMPTFIKCYQFVPYLFTYIQACNMLVMLHICRTERRDIEFSKCFANSCHLLLPLWGFVHQKTTMALKLTKFGYVKVTLASLFKKTLIFLQFNIFCLIRQMLSELLPWW